MIVPNLHLEKTHTWKNPGKNPKKQKKNGFMVFFQDFGFLPNPEDQTHSTCSDQSTVHIWMLMTPSSISFLNLLDCYDGNGASYRGRKKTTLSGQICQAWASQSPHRHDKTPDRQVRLNYICFCLFFWWLVHKIEKTNVNHLIKTDD